MSKHTPGPWTFLPHVSGGYEIIQDTPPGYRIGVIDRAPSKFDPPELNAKFVTAAPETAAERDRLREALETYADEVERLAFEIKAPNPYTPQFAQLAVAMRRAATAKTKSQLDGE